MGKTKKLNVSTIIAALSLLISIAGWAIKTTVSNMILKETNKTLNVKLEDYKSELRWCYRSDSEDRPLIPTYLLEAPESEISEAEESENTNRDN